MMKHIANGNGKRKCGLESTSEWVDEYVTDAQWRKLPECPTCFSGYEPPTLVEQERKPYNEQVPAKDRRAVYLRQYLG